MSKNEQQPVPDPKAGSDEEVSDINIEDLSNFEIRRIIAEAMFSPKSKTHILFQYAHCTDEITPKQLRTVSRGTMDEINQFIDDKASDLSFSDKITIINKNTKPTA